MRGLVLFAHGARDPQWAQPFEAIRDRIRSQRPGVPVTLAYLEGMSPTLDEAIAAVARQGATSITVFPLFMAQGGHLKQDLPRMVGEIRSRNPRLAISLESAIGEVPELIDAIAGWVVRKV